MDYTLSYTLTTLERWVGPDQLRLRAPATLQIEFVYEAGVPGRAYLANGDPGEDGAPETFDFKHLITSRPLELTSDDATLTLLIAAGDLYSRLTQAELDAIETALLRRQRDAAADDRIDVVLAGRFDDDLQVLR